MEVHNISLFNKYFHRLISTSLLFQLMSFVQTDIYCFYKLITDVENDTLIDPCIVKLRALHFKVHKCAVRFQDPIYTYGI